MLTAPNLVWLKLLNNFGRVIGHAAKRYGGRAKRSAGAALVSLRANLLPRSIISGEIVPAIWFVTATNHLIMIRPTTAFRAIAHQILTFYLAIISSAADKGLLSSPVILSLAATLTIVHLGSHGHPPH